MSTLILAQRRILAVRMPFSEVSFAESFVRLNEKGALTVSLISLLGLFSAAYLGAVYFSFYEGLSLRDAGKKIGILEKSVLELELVQQNAIGSLDQGKNAVLESMEKVSQIKYLTPENFAALEMRAQPIP